MFFFLSQNRVEEETNLHEPHQLNTQRDNKRTDTRHQVSQDVPLCCAAAAVMCCGENRQGSFSSR